MTGPVSLRRFVARVLLLLTPCFAAWFLAAPWHTAIVAPLALQFVEPWRMGLVAALERNGYMLSFVTSLEAVTSGTQVGFVVADVNPLVYTYGLALFLCLMLATGARAWKIVAGAAVLLLFQAASVAFDFLVQVAILSGPEVASRTGLARWQREAIALGYQFGTLIVPSLVPVLLWATFNRAMFASAQTGVPPTARDPERGRRHAAPRDEPHAAGPMRYKR
jgi:hypothetical protein